MTAFYICAGCRRGFESIEDKDVHACTRVGVLSFARYSWRLAWRVARMNQGMTLGQAWPRLRNVPFSFAKRAWAAVGARNRAQEMAHVLTRYLQGEKK